MTALAVHCHDTHGQALANTLTALQVIRASSDVGHTSSFSAAGRQDSCVSVILSSKPSLCAHTCVPGPRLATVDIQTCHPALKVLCICLSGVQVIILTHCDNVMGTEDGPHPSRGWGGQRRFAKECLSEA